MTLGRGVPDRVPVDYQANPGIDARLKAHFGLAANDDEGLRRALGVDFRDRRRPVRRAAAARGHPERGVKVDEWGIHRRWVEHESGGYWDFCDFPLQEADEEAVAAGRCPTRTTTTTAASPTQCRRWDEYADLPRRATAT